MRLAEKQHGNARLADAAADGQGEFPVQKRLMVRQGTALIMAGQAELSVERLRIDADAHGGHLHRAAEPVTPEEDIPVERPVVIVGSAAVMRLAGLERAADADDENGFMLLREGILALLGRKAGIHILKLLRRDEGDAPLQPAEALELGIYGLHGVLRVADGGDDVHDGGLEIVDIPVFGQDDLFPVPLIDVDGVEIIQHVLIAADGVHVRAQAPAGVEPVALEREALPLCEGVDDLRGLVGTEDVEGDWALNAVEVVIQAGTGLDKERGRDTVKIQRRAEPVLKQALEKPYRLLRVVNAKQAFVAFGNYGIHDFFLFSSLKRAINF